jgi:hypothetical protein
MTSPKGKPGGSFPADHYFHLSQQPLQSLFFLLPLVAAYEIGIVAFPLREGDAWHAGSRVTILAKTYLSRFLAHFGALGDYLPGLLVVGALLGIHVARRDAWRFEPRLYLAMAFESIAWAMPLLIFGVFFGWKVMAQAGGAGDLSSMPLSTKLVAALGAGVYEELLFRLVGIAAMHTLLVNVLQLDDRTGSLLAVAASAAAFARYHFDGSTPILLAPFAFYFLAGCYFGVCYALRGFGIVVATHAIYDVVIFSLQEGVIPAR